MTTLMQKLAANAFLKEFRHSVAGLTLIFASGNFLSNILRMIGGLLTARAVEPAVLGLFNGLGLVLGYAPLLQLGILNGLGRELPYYIGRGDKEEASEMAAAAQAWSLLVGIVVAAGLLMMAAWQAWQSNWQLAAGWVTFAFTAFLLFYAKNYLQILYRTHSDFARLALIDVVHNFISVVTVIFVWLFGFYGLCLRAIIGGAVNMGMLWRWRPLHVKPHWDVQRLWHLIKIGAPIFAVGQIWSLWSVLDLTLVLHYLGTEGLGIYQLAVIVGTSFALLKQSLSQILYPRMAQEYGRTGEIADLFKIAYRTVAALVIMTIPLIWLGWILIPPLAAVLLPQYTDGIPAAQWTLIAVGILSLAPLNNIFNVVKRQDLYFVAMLFGAITYYVALRIFIVEDISLTAFPQAMALGNGVFIVLCYLFLLFLWKKRDEDLYSDSHHSVS